MRFVGSILTIMVLASPLPAATGQRFRETTVRVTADPQRQAECVFRLRVGHEAEVALRSDVLQFRTFHNNEVEDLGSECSAPLGRAVSQFRLAKLDGRGDVWLAEEPAARNGWKLVFGIHDKKSDPSDYAVRVTWREALKQEQGVIDAWGSNLLVGSVDSPRTAPGAYRWTALESTGTGGLRIDGATRDAIVRIVAAERSREIIDVLARAESGRQYWLRARPISWDRDRIEAALVEFDGAPAAGRLMLQTGQDGQWVERVSLDGSFHGDKLKLEFRR